MKERFIKELVLAALNLDKKIRMEVDMSNYMTREVLNCETHDKEILAVIKGLENWRHVLKGAKFKFKI